MSIRVQFKIGLESGGYELCTAQILHIEIEPNDREIANFVVLIEKPPQESPILVVTNSEIIKAWNTGIIS